MFQPDGGSAGLVGDPFRPVFQLPFGGCRRRVELSKWRIFDEAGVSPVFKDLTSSKVLLSTVTEDKQLPEVIKEISAEVSVILAILKFDG